MAQLNPGLIGLDWGTSSLRAYLLGENGRVLAEKTQPWGVMSEPGGDFGAAYHAAVAHWRTADQELPALASGMIGSTEGWVRAAYRPCPAGAPELAAALAPIATNGDGTLWVVPGVEQRGRAPNVMRGEETQVVGALTLRPELRRAATLVLPGTHSKWVDVRAGRIVGFATYMTGELFGVLSEHSILGRPARGAAPELGQTGPPAWDAFDRGVSLAQESGSPGIAQLLFLTRSLVLHGALRAEDSLDFLSGLLIGDELRCAGAAAAQQLVLVGEPALCERYRRGLAAGGVDAPILEGAAPAGLWRIAGEAGLVATPFSYV
jgi:2-dehydro-3-deoxygalactonokinase